MNHAFFLSAHYTEPEDVGHAPELLRWQFPNLSGDIHGFMEPNRVLPENYGKNFSFRWIAGEANPKWADANLFAPLGCILVSSRLAQLLVQTSEAPGNYQFIEPVFLPDSLDCNHVGYKLLKIHDHVAALDFIKSDLVLDEDGSVNRIHKPVLRHDAVEGLMHLFRIKEYPLKIGLSRQLGEVLLKSRLTGFALDPVELA